MSGGSRSTARIRAKTAASGSEPAPPLANRRRERNRNRIRIRTLLGLGFGFIAIFGAGFFVYYSDDKSAEARELMRVVTPLPAPKMMDLPQFQGEHKESLYWGTYRPHVYLGIRARTPQSLIAGLMWIGIKDGQYFIRHVCQDSDGLSTYGWKDHNGRDYGRQVIVDHGLSLTTSFLKTKGYGGGYGGDWAVRINVQNEKCWQLLASARVAVMAWASQTQVWNWALKNMSILTSIRWWGWRARIFEAKHSDIHWIDLELGSKEEIFFDSKAWLDSDCEDDFYSVNGDFTPSRGNTPKHHFSTSGTPQVNKSLHLSTFLDFKAEPSPTDGKRKLFDLLQEASQGELMGDEQNIEINGKANGYKLTNNQHPRSSEESPYPSRTNSVQSSEATPGRDFNNRKERIGRAKHCCFPGLMPSHS